MLDYTGNNNVRDQLYRYICECFRGGCGRHAFGIIGVVQEGLGI
jgi:hypothetical protein